tara:strand:- start:267 stop:500 length:234 start_codon:yes stop_codon:yes gene_type:complete
MKLKGKWLPSNDKPADTIRAGDKQEMVNVLSILKPQKTICYEEKCTEDNPKNLTIVNRFTFCHIHALEFQKKSASNK